MERSQNRRTAYSQVPLSGWIGLCCCRHLFQRNPIVFCGTTGWRSNCKTHFPLLFLLLLYFFLLCFACGLILCVCVTFVVKGIGTIWHRHHVTFRTGGCTAEVGFVDERQDWWPKASTWKRVACAATNRAGDCIGNTSVRGKFEASGPGSWVVRQRIPVV